MDYDPWLGFFLCVYGSRKFRKRLSANLRLLRTEDDHELMGCKWSSHELKISLIYDLPPVQIHSSSFNVYRKEMIAIRDKLTLSVMEWNMIE